MAPQTSSPPGLTRWSMRKRGEGNRAANLSKPSLSMDCRIKSGNDDMKIRSRDAGAPELCQRQAQNRPAEHDPVRLGRRWNRLPSRSCPTNKREAERRQARSPTSAPCGRGSPLRTSPQKTHKREARRGARLSAFHRGSCQRALARGLCSRPGFLGRGSGGRYPPLPVPVQWKHPTHRS